MTFEFDADAPFIVVNGSYSTGSGTVFVLRLLLDTGASSSVVKPTVLQGLIDLRANRKFSSRQNSQWSCHRSRSAPACTICFRPNARRICGQRL